MRLVQGEPITRQVSRARGVALRVAPWRSRYESPRAAVEHAHAPSPAEATHRRSAGSSAREPPGHYAVYGEILIELLPAKGLSAGLDADLGQLLGSRVAQARELGGRDADVSAVRQFDPDHTRIAPSPDGANLGRRRHARRSTHATSSRTPLAAPGPPVPARSARGF